MSLWWRCYQPKRKSSSGGKRIKLRACNGRQLLEPKQRVYIESDASTIGWGTTLGKWETGGFWSEAEREMHINALELLRTDNSTAAAYISKMGGTRSKLLNSITKSLWVWCLERHLSPCRTHSWGRKYLCRLAVAKHHRPK